MESHPCLLCGEQFDSEQELQEHHELVHEPEEEATWWELLLAIPVLLIVGWRWVIGAIILGAVVLGSLGVFDKTPTAETKNCAGYRFVRELKSEAQIENFQSVEPESGWLCEYSLNDEEAFVRFKRRGRELELEIEGSGATNDAFEGASELADTQGYANR